MTDPGGGVEECSRVGGVCVFTLGECSGSPGISCRHPHRGKT